MTQNTFQVVFSGVTVPGADREQVKRNLAQLFKVPAERIEPMFSGRRVVVKKGLPQEMAVKYQAALSKAGAVSEVVDEAAAATSAPAAAAPASGASEPKPVAPQPTPAAPAPSPVPQAPVAPAPAAAAPAPAMAAGSDGPGLAPPGAPIPSLAISRATVKEAPQGFGELEGAVIDQPDRMVAVDDTPPPVIDTSGLSVAEVGATLVEPEPFEELQVDLSALTMAEPGATLVEHKEEPEPQIDTSKITLA